MARDGVALLEARHLRLHFPVRGGLWRRVVGRVHAVDDVSFAIAPGETLGLVGESGCGKSTVGKTLLQLLKGYRGEILLQGRPVPRGDAAALRALRQQVQMIFQDPMESLNPRQSVAEIIEEPLVIHGIGHRGERQQRVRELAERVGLSSSALQRYPHEFSGGQRQRIGIARAIALAPKLIICDEPVSALDVSIQSQILNLLLEIQRDTGTAMLFISHDLAVVKHVSHRIAVMYLGQLVEVAEAQALYATPRHPYTRSLLEAIPRPEPTARRRRAPLGGEPPSPIDPPAGCRFHPRCALAVQRCRTEAPLLETRTPGHQVACHLWSEVNPQPEAGTELILGPS